MEISYKPYYQSSWALVIGVNAYQNVPPLSYACNDADAVSKSLVDELQFPSENVFLLKDGKATKQAIMDTFLQFHDKANNPDDRVLVFFAGHGFTLEGLRGQIGYLVPVDGDTKSMISLIRWDELTRNSELIFAKHILFILDACYSGLALQRAVAPGSQRFISDMLQRLSRQVITAGMANEVVADGGGPQGKNSIFTGYLLDGIKGGAADSNGILTANELMAYVYKKVGQDTRSKQTPHYGHLDGDGDFILRTPNLEHINQVSHKEYLISTAKEEPEIIQGEIPHVTKSNFLFKNGYSDPTSPSFGRNDWSKRLIELRGGVKMAEGKTRAYSWTNLTLEPVIPLAKIIDIYSLSMSLKNERPIGKKPFEQLRVPPKILTTIDSIIMFDDTSSNSSSWNWYLRIDRNGNIELSDTQHIFIELDGIRCFSFVQIIGLTWQFMFFSKNLLHNAGYQSGVRLNVNLVGTRESILIDFSKNPGEDNKHWVSPFDRGGLFDQEKLLQMKCPNANLQMDYQFILDELDENSSLGIIKNVANNLSLAYNHQSMPRCFNYNTDVFPWNQYNERWRW